MDDSIKPVPDPTSRTTQDLIRTVNAERDYVDGKVEAILATLNGKVETIQQRLEGYDRAATVLHETVTRVPTEMQLAIGHLKDVMGEKFKSVEVQFTERDDRTKAEGVANEVKVNAAFAAQEKLAVQQNLSNQISIDKSEKNTIKSIEQNADKAQISFQSQQDQINDLKDRITKAESFKQGGTETSIAWKAAIGLGISLILLGITVVGFILAFKKP